MKYAASKEEVSQLFIFSAPISSQSLQVGTYHSLSSPRTEFLEQLWRALHRPFPLHTAEALLSKNQHFNC